MIGFLVIFVLALIIIAFLCRPWIKSLSDYAAAGREASAFVLSLSVSLMMIASTTLFFSPGIAITAGFWTSFFSVFWSAIGYILMGYTLGRVVRRSGVYTIPEWLETRFDRQTRLVGSVVTLLALWGVMQPQIYGLGHILAAIFNVDYVYAAIASTIVYFVYLYLGGVWASLATSLIMGAVVYTSLPVSWIWLSKAYGGWVSILNQFPDAAKINTLGGGWGFLFPGLLTLLAMWVLIPLGGQENWFKCASARNERALVQGHLWGGILIAVFFTAGLSIYGYYALAMYPGSNFHPFDAFSLMLKKMPPWLGGYLLLMALSASFSTGGPIMLGAGQVIVRDIYQTSVKPQATPEELVLPARLATIAFGVICLVAALALEWVTWYALSIGAAFILAFLFPILLGLFWPRLSPAAAKISVAATAVVELFWIVMGYDARVLHPIWVALIVSAIVCVVLSFVTVPKYYAVKGFRVGTAQPFKPVDLPSAEDYTLSDQEVLLLDCVRKGFRTTALIADLLRTSGSEAVSLVDRLEKVGLVVRESYKGAGLFTLYLTKEGWAVLEKRAPLSPAEEETLLRFGVGEQSLRILREITRTPGAPTSAIAASCGVDPISLIAHLELLEGKGYIRRTGLLRQKVFPTTVGAAVPTHPAFAV